jgi:hypothetical protein
MIDLTPFKDNILANVPAIKQVILPELVQACNVDTSALLTTVLSPVMDNRVYAYRLPDKPVYPALTFEQQGMDYAEMDGYPITRTDSYLLSIQANVLSDIITKANAVEETLIEYAATGVAGGMQIVDKATRYQYDLKRFETGIELNVVHLALASQQIPVVYLYPLQQKAEENRSQRSIVQKVSTQFAAILVMSMPETGLSGIDTNLSAVRSQIIGKKSTLATGALVELVSGQEVGKIGSLVCWRDVYSVPSTINYVGNW